MMKLKTILFDLGGVLIHLNKDECVRRFENLGVSDASRMLDPYLQNGLFLQLENGALNAENFRKALSEHTSKEITHDEIKWGLCGFLEEIPPYKFDYIDCLREKYSVYIISNTNPYVMEYAHSKEFLPNGRTLSSYVDGIFASYEMKMVKPDPNIFTYMPQKAGFLPEEALFIDDGPANVEMAAKMGYQTYCPLNYFDWRPVLDEILHNQ